jgi:hypothetical protein
VLRVEFARGRTANGRDVAWHSIRLFWRDEAGELHPGRQGISIRARELPAVAEALSRAVSGGHPQAEAARAPTARSPEHRHTSAAQPELPDETYRRMRNEGRR